MISSAGRGFPQWVELRCDDMDRLHPPWLLPPAVPGQQILLYPQDNLSPVLCHAPVSRAWWTSSTGHVTVTRAVPRQWWSTWPEGHSRGMAPVVATSKGQSRPPGRRPRLAYSNPSPSSHGSEMVKSDRRGLILTKPNQTWAATGQSRPGCSGRSGPGRGTWRWAGNTQDDIAIACLQDCRRQS